MEFPRIEMGGNCRYNWEHKGPPPPKRRPHFSISALIVVSPRVGWGSVLFPPPPPSEAGRSSSLTSCPWRQVLQSICTLFQV